MNRRGRVGGAAAGDGRCGEVARAASRIWREGKGLCAEMDKGLGRHRGRSWAIGEPTGSLSGTLQVCTYFEQMEYLWYDVGFGFVVCTPSVSNYKPFQLSSRVKASQVFVV